MKLNISVANIIESVMRGSIKQSRRKMTFFDDAHSKIFHLTANLSNNKSISNERESLTSVYIYTAQTRTFFTLSHRPLKVNVHTDGEINKPIGSPIYARL